MSTTNGKTYERSDSRTALNDFWHLIWTPIDKWEVESQHCMTCYPLNEVNAEIAELEDALKGMVRIVKAMRMSTGLGKDQVARLERANALISHRLNSQNATS